MKRFSFLFLLIFFLFLSGCSKPVEPELPNEPLPDEGEEVEENEVLKEEIFAYLLNEYENKIIDCNFDYIKNYQEKATIQLYSFDEEYLDNDGNYFPPIVDYHTELLFVVTIDGKEYEIFIPVVFKGTGDEFDAIVAEIDKEVPKYLSISITLPTTSMNYNCKIEWESDDESVITSKGTITKDKIERDAILFYRITFNNETREYFKVVTVAKMSNTEKLNIVREWLNEKMSAIDVVDSDIELPKKHEELGAYIIWESWNPTTLSSNGKYTKQFRDEKVILEATISISVNTIKQRYTFTTKGENEEDMWKKIENFLERINVKEVKNQKFYLYGWEEGYQRIPTQNIGYLPFYDQKEMEIKVDLLPDSSPLKPNTLRTATKYVVIHNTGMGHPTATAEGLNEYIHTTDRIASWHFSIDDKETYQHLGLDEVGWHAGDGSTTYLNPGSGGIGGGNQNGIGIESCVYAGVDFNKVMRRLAKLAAMLLIEYDLGINDVKQHYDFSGKDCPQVIRQSQRWNELLELIRLEYFAQTELKDVSFEWISLNPEIMDNEGTVINHPGEETEISYKVKVTYNGETKEYTFNSKLLELKG